MHREVKWLTQDQAAAGKWQSQDLNPDGQDCRVHVLTQSARPQKEASMQSWAPRICR